MITYDGRFVPTSKHREQPAIADGAVHGFSGGGFADVKLACTLWLRRRGLEYDNPTQELYVIRRFGERDEAGLRRRLLDPEQQAHAA